MPMPVSNGYWATRHNVKSGKVEIVQLFRILNLITLFMAVFVTLPVHAQRQMPAGWTVTNNANGTTYASAASKEVVQVTSFPDPANITNMDFAQKLLSSLNKVGCGPANTAFSDLLFQGQAIRLTSIKGNVRCTVTIGRKAGTMHAFASVGNTSTDVAGGFSYALAAEKFGASGPSTVTNKAAPPTQQAATRPAPPVGSAGIGKTVQSARTSGIWIGLGQRTVYDPVLTVRLEYGTYYLILTPGGYFMTDYPEKAPFNDAAAQAMARKYPEQAGKFQVQGNNLILRFASGKTETVVGKGAGASRNYVYDEIDYAPKLRFADGTLLNGSYSNTRITRTGADSFVVGDHDLTFTREGRFAKGGRVSVSGGFYSILGGSSSEVGRYFVRDSAVHLQYDNGKTEILSIWAEKPDNVIWFDGDMYKRPGD